ncbi:MAG: ubiD 1 [Herminiimonas sp.]|nr:ubiD 1 [Herminiimonas sp.]
MEFPRPVPDGTVMHGIKLEREMRKKANNVSMEDGPAAPARGYRDLHEHLEALDKAGLLVTIDRQINKDTELHPLVRWQFRGGIAEPDRKAFLFTNVVDGKGRKYDIPVVVGALAASRKIYSAGMDCALEDIGKTWNHAIANPILPNVVKTAPCQEIVVMGKDLEKPGMGLDSLPIPISTPGWDNAPYTTLSQYISKDPETGIQNMGIYRGQVKSPTRLGMNPSLENQPGIYTHWEKAKARGEKLAAAVILGCPPCVAFTSAQKLSEDTDELHVAGGLAGAPINVVKCKTVDLLVPAEAEIVIEGYINTEWLEPEAPFGESHGHVNLQEFNAYMEVTAITRRKKAILTSIISQVTPSESSLIKRVALEPVFLNHLKRQMGIKGVIKVSMHEPLTNLRKVLVVVVDRKTPPTEVWRALYGAASLLRSGGKLVIAVNDDIDPDNADALLWAMSYRANFALDLQILNNRDPGHGPRSPRNNGVDAALLVDATLKDDFPPIALPKKEYMENAKAIWEELGLPKLKPEAPWHGYSLGDWSPRNEEMAQRAVRSDYFITGEEIAKQRRNDVAMNTEIQHIFNPDSGKVEISAKKKAGAKKPDGANKKSAAVVKKKIKSKK